MELPPSLLIMEGGLVLLLGAMVIAFVYWLTNRW
jgi:hypothetical protein